MATRVLGMVAVAAVLLAGCAHRNTRLPEEKESTFTIGREDVLDVAVWRDPDLSRTVPVRPDGFISMPLVGEVKAEGKTPEGLAKELNEKLGAYVQTPKVTVIVREVNSSRVYVTGEVARPGAYPLRGRMSLVQAISLAGGFSDFADKGAIRLIRQGEEQAISVSYADLVGDDAAKTTFTLRPGDTIVVP
jgi:polysaccharide export outer membrane protein